MHDAIGTNFVAIIAIRHDWPEMGLWVRMELGGQVARPGGKAASMQFVGRVLQEAFDHYGRGDLPAAEALLSKLPDHASALHLLGVLRVRQGRLDDAAELLGRSVAIRPSEAQAQFNFGKVLNALGRNAEASQALRTALALDANLFEAALLLGKTLDAQDRTREAADAYRIFLAARPDHVSAKIALGHALAELGESEEAETLLSGALSETVDAHLRAGLHQSLASLLRKKHPDRALEHLDQAQALDPASTDLDPDRAVLLEEMHCFQEAKTVYEQLLARNPVNAKAHRDYNELLYRLGNEDEFLSSYERAPRTQELLLDKAQLLLSAGRFEEAQRCYGDALARYAYNKQAALGVGVALVGRGCFAEAIAAFERVTLSDPKSVDAYCNLAGALAQSGDPQRACAAAQTALAIEPENQIALAMLGTSLRLMDDPRDEILNGYDDFIQVYDLDPPEGYADMASFNAELSAFLDAKHPPSREYLRQSLRGGTQTRDNLFGSGHTPVEKLKQRIIEAVGRYIAGLKRDEHHPFLSRARMDFRFTGSWSSKLGNGGFHINHVHPRGWISSCYYVDLPQAVQDEAGRQGWIKFGEPSFDVGLSIRRAIQPKVGRLVLFPSYMWHGTVPFHDSHARITVAFDILPSSRA